MLQSFKLFQERIHLAHFKVDDLSQRAVFELLEHLITMHGLTFEQPQDGIFCWLADVHRFPQFMNKNRFIIVHWFSNGNMLCTRPWESPIEPTYYNRRIIGSHINPFNVRTA